MMQRRRVFQRVAIGLVLVVLAGCIAFVIRDLLASRQPENALPTMDVYHNRADGERLPAANIMTCEYSWQFLFHRVLGTVSTPDAWLGMEPAWVNPGSPLSVDFTFDEKTLKVSMSELGADGNYRPFVELGGSLQAPVQPGTYAYRVEAGWGDGRQVTYYFKIRTPEW